tara:strand:- start:735 stop:872 length:138 start_codon:yes stop_codon:yes gene_type:complete
MNRGLVYARVDRGGVDIDPIELSEDVLFVLYGDPADLDSVLTRSA